MGDVEVKLDDKELTDLAMKMDKLFNLLESQGVVERIDANGNVLFEMVKGRENDFYGVFDYVMKSGVGR